MLYGSEIRNLTSESQARRHARRSIVASKDIVAGECLSDKNLTTKRPAHGISPVLWDEIVGKKALSNIKEDDCLSFNDFCNEWILGLQ